MRKRVIRSLVFGALAIMMISFLVLTPIFFFSFQSEAVDGIYTEMQDSISHIKPLARISLSLRTSKMDKVFNESMSQIAYFSKANILFIDNTGDVIWANGIPGYVDSSMLKSYASEALFAIGGREHLSTKNLLNELYGEKTLTIGESVKNDAGENAWYVFCSKPAPNFSRQYKLAFLEIFSIEVVTLFFVAVFMYLFSGNITRPLNKINNTLKEFARGNFDKRVEYKHNNEIGELALNINKMADSIGALEKMRQDFVSDISHELRTPITSISGFISGILDGTVPKEEHEKYLRIVLSEARRLSRLLNELISLSRIEDSVKKLEMSDFDIEEMSKIVLLKFEKQITDKNIDVSFELEGEDFIVHADRDKYTQVLINLIHNSVKFTPNGGRICISIKKEGKKCIFNIANSGIGIPEDKLKFIWERFYKADNSRSTDRSGIGLGLYIVKKIIDAHDEKISVESRTGEGTAFEFTIELA